MGKGIEELIPCDTTPDPELTPGQPETCAGNIENGGSCCDECDHFLQCFPEFSLKASEPEAFREMDACLNVQKRTELFGAALVHTYPSALTDGYADVLAAFEAYMRQEFGRCEELDSEWARNRIRGVRALHMLDTAFSE